MRGIKTIESTIYQLDKKTVNLIRLIISDKEMETRMVPLNFIHVMNWVWARVWAVFRQVHDSVGDMLTDQVPFFIGILLAFMC